MNDNKKENNFNSWNPEDELRYKPEDRFESTYQEFRQNPAANKDEKMIECVAVSKKDRKMDRGVKTFLIISTAIFTLCVVLSLSLLTASYLNKHKGSLPWESSVEKTASTVNSEGPTLQTVDYTETEGTMTAEQIYQKLAPSIVGIVTYNPSQGLISSSTGQGSGIIMSNDGYIITNAHVIGNTNKYNVTVVTGDKKEYTAKVVGYDTRTDVAVLKIEASDLTAAEFGNSDQLNVGAWVLAIGNPGGLEFSNTLTRGLVSAVNRSIGASNSPVKYIQTDAAINPGNSGGALLNMYGQVIGVNSAKASEYEGIGFAIPINTVKTVVDDIIKRGYVSGRAKLGITVRPLSVFEAQANDVPQGVLVAEINDESQASAGGLKPGDIIIKMDGENIRTTTALYGQLEKHSPGDKVGITVYRLSPTGNEGSTHDLQVTLIEDKG